MHLKKLNFLQKKAAHKNKNKEYKDAKTILKNNNYDDYLYWILHNKLISLKNLAEDYYLNINASYYIVRNYLYNSIYELDNLINKCANITFKTF